MPGQKLSIASKSQIKNDESVTSALEIVNYGFECSGAERAVLVMIFPIGKRLYAANLAVSYCQRLVTWGIPCLINKAAEI